jgi:uncharacterized membrane protein
LSDLSSGFVVYAFPTAIIKGAMGFVCGRLMEHAGFARFIMATAIGGAIMTGGYAAFDAVWFNVNQMLVTLPFNIIQYICGVAVSVVFYPVIPRIKKIIER